MLQRSSFDSPKIEEISPAGKVSNVSPEGEMFVAQNQSRFRIGNKYYKLNNDKFQTLNAKEEAEVRERLTKNQKKA